MDEKTPTVAASYGSQAVSFNKDYLLSAPGVMKLGELIFGLLCWALVAAVYLNPFINTPAYQFVLFVSVTSWILTTALFIVGVLGLNNSKFSTAPWGIIEFSFNASWGLLYFVASCVAAAYSGQRPHLIVATVFAFLTTNLYITDASFAYKQWKGAFPWQQAGTQTNVSA
ncbi:plasmolipin-like isoform X2 [Clavelina lepadiformis]